MWSTCEEGGRQPCLTAQQQWPHNQATATPPTLHQQVPGLLTVLPAAGLWSVPAAEQRAAMEAAVDASGHDPDGAPSADRPLRLASLPEQLNVSTWAALDCLAQDSSTDSSVQLWRR